MYKVVTNRHGLLCSAYVNTVEELNVEYKVGQWVRPKVEDTKLFVFTKLCDALDFIKGNEYTGPYGSNVMEIYTCSVLNPVYNYDKYIPSVIGIKSACWRYSNSRLHRDLSYYLHSVEKPSWSSTIYCDAVKLLELVPRENLESIC